MCGNLNVCEKQGGSVDKVEAVRPLDTRGTLSRPMQASVSIRFYEANRIGVPAADSRASNAVAVDLNRLQKFVDGGASLGNIPGTRFDGRVARGIAAPRSPRTGREPLDSSGSHHPTVAPRVQCANRFGLRRLSELNHFQVAFV